MKMRNTTTTLMSVYDTFVKENESQSLNQYLEKGVNVIEVTTEGLVAIIEYYLKMRLQNCYNGKIENWAGNYL